ncbi:unnamed protein product [Ceutorhynchus assimilis]|uniref:DUF4806 domain-containing protein n=1 Tax=Ceutorhynchus assimilis TaxID=467358 RepID=A0A9N9QS77_9CUCU|nr:unnamed protein product [Ceutorhynchus assimilis]
MEKKFAVIYFPAENIYSEVPTSWLAPDRKHCWWPNSINAKPFMVRGELPDESVWVLHEVKLEAYASTLETARKKADNPDFLTGGEDLLLPEKRFRKPRTLSPALSNNSSSSETPITPPPSPLKLKKNKSSKKKIDSIKKLVLSEPSQLPEIHQPFRTLATYDDNDEDFVEIESLPIVFEGNDEIGAKQNTVEEASNSACEGTQLDEFMATIKNLTITCNNVQKYVISIDNRLKDMTSNQGKVLVNDVIKNLEKNLPLNSQESVRAFDTLLNTKAEVKNTFAQFIKRIGGRDAKDHINRCLPKLFTNEFAKESSYLGLRGNFKLQQFNFMQILIDVLVVQHSATLQNVEKHIGEWFRLANQRLKRLEKK